MPVKWEGALLTTPKVSARMPLQPQSLYVTSVVLFLFECLTGRTCEEKWNNDQIMHWVSKKDWLCDASNLTKQARSKARVSWLLDPQI